MPLSACEAGIRNACVEYSLGKFIPEVDQAYYEDAVVFISHNGHDVVSGIIGKELRMQPSHTMNTTPLKFVFAFPVETGAIRFQNYTRTFHFLKNSYISRFWHTGVEITAVNATKGHALNCLKKHIRNIHTSLGVSNYENDIPLLLHANIGVAVDNALDSVKREADWTVCSASDGAIADVIRRLENNIPAKR